MRNREQSLLDRAFENPLLALIVMGLFGTVAFALLSSLWQSLAYVPSVKLARWLLILAALIPIIAVAAYQVGEATGEKQGRDRGWTQRARVASHERAGILKRSEERGAAFLKGAERGLGVAASVAKARAAARPTPEPLALPPYRPPAYEVVDETGKLIDVG